MATATSSNTTSSFSSSYQTTSGTLQTRPASALFVEVETERVSPRGREKSEKPPLPCSDVFNRIRPLMCFIDSAIGESSGFLLNKTGTVLTVSHNIPIGNREGNAVYAAEYVQVSQDNTNNCYFPTSSEGIVQEKAETLDLYSLETGIISPESVIIPMLPANIPIKEGMEVYFAGYPLGQNVVTFHKGNISSISIDQGIMRFTIDGTVVPGSSGGPVVIQHEGLVYLIGVITSEVADFSPEDQRTIAIMKAIKKQRKTQEGKNANFPPNTVVFSNFGITTPVQINTSEGSEIVHVNDRDVTYLALKLFQRNLSTGIGKAIDVRHYVDLMENLPKLEKKTSTGFSVARGKKLIADTIAKNEGNRQIPLMKYIEVRYGRGKGHRGIKTTLFPTLGVGSYTYRFSPNPHTSQGNYNKNRKELYMNAAKYITTELFKQKIPPNEFSFAACESRYTAVLQK